MHPFMMHMDNYNVVLCFTYPKLNKETHTAGEPRDIVSTNIKHLPTTTAAVVSPW